VVSDKLRTAGIAAVKSFGAKLDVERLTVFEVVVSASLGAKEEVLKLCVAGIMRRDATGANVAINRLVVLGLAVVPETDAGAKAASVNDRVVGTSP